MSGQQGFHGLQHFVLLHSGQSGHSFKESKKGLSFSNLTLSATTSDAVQGTPRPLQGLTRFTLTVTP